MTGYSSSIGDQLSRKERAIKAYLKRMLLQLGRRFRARMNAERLSGPPGVFKVTGKLARSLRYNLVETGAGYALEAFIGGGAAYYAAEHEERGRLEFMRVFREESEKVLAEIKLGLQFFAESATSEQAAPLPEAEVSPAIAEIGRYIKQKRESAKLKRAMNWHSMTRERRDPGALAKRRAAKRKAHSYRVRRDMKWRSLVVGS